MNITNQTHTYSVTPEDRTLLIDALTAKAASLGSRLETAEGQHQDIIVLLNRKLSNTRRLLARVMQG